MASQELNPMIIPPDIPKKILHKIIEDIKSNARLKSCEDPETNIYLKDMGDPLVFSTHIGPNMASFKFYSHHDKDSLKLHSTFSNLGDLQDQLYYLWVQLNYALKGE